MNLQEKSVITRFFTVVAIAVILVIGAVMIWPTYQRGLELEREEAALDRRIEEKKAEIARICEYQRRFREDRDFLENIARQNRRVYPGELVFTFED